MEERATAWFRSKEGREKWEKERHKTRLFIGLGTVPGPGFRDLARWCGVECTERFEEWLTCELMAHYVALRELRGTCGVRGVDAAIASGRWTNNGVRDPSMSHWGIRWSLNVGRASIGGLYTKAVDALFVHFPPN